MRLFFIAIALVCTAPALAQLHSCEVDGKTIYVTDPSGKNCRNREAAPRGGEARTAPAPVPAPAPSSKPKPIKIDIPSAHDGSRAGGKKPVVSSGTQKLRDRKRGQVLQHELEKEEARYNYLMALMVTEQNKQTVDKRRIARLKERIHIRQQNIKAIRQELARL